MSAMAIAQTPAAARYDNSIQTAVTQKLTSKEKFNDVKASVEDGIVTLTGTVDLYQGKLDAAKTARKISGAQGVRNLIEVAGANVPDAELEQKLAKKLRFVRVGYDNTFDYFALGVKDGVVRILPALIGEALIGGAQIFDETVAIRIAQPVDPAERRLDGGPQSRQGFLVVGALGIEAGQQHEQRNNTCNRGSHRVLPP